MAQPPLSRAITQLERRLATALLERTSRKVTLTAAGGVPLVRHRRRNPAQPPSSYCSARHTDVALLHRPSTLQPGWTPNPVHRGTGRDLRDNGDRLAGGQPPSCSR
ncbi:LysR family transcriptional regulator [Streptomyces anandii]|uniref:helix-turn-helix domain-containing protein n=1 Tax=Streptomyces anandii TaxID=285454 RepID=UPI0036FA5605